ncbi:UbiB [Gracilaria domingensis]|nr:UbiB [Gracilaria domingensis]
MVLTNRQSASKPAKPAKPAKPLPATRSLPPDSYIGTPAPERHGTLRLDYAQRFLLSDEPPAPPPLETRRSTAWQRGNYVSRSVAIWSFIGRILFQNWLDSKPATYWMFKRTDAAVRERRRRLAAYSREQILRLGPTLIKVGQLASTRADILPPEVISELSSLQDRVPAFSWNTAERLLKEQYGKELSDVFAFFDKTPIAAASLGQVYRARLFTGEQVVVKVQRPNLNRLFDLDLNALKVVAKYLQKSKTYGGNGRDWVAIADEVAKVLYEEIDYVREANSCQRFRDNFKNAGISYVKVPKVYMQYTTRTVLCLQYLPGIKVTDKGTLERAGLDLPLVANRLGDAFIRQVLDFAFFSSDPHPGNCAIGANETIIFYDFGMMGELNPRIKERLIDILRGVIDKDAQVVMDALVDLDALVLPSDPSPVRRSIQFFLDSIGSRPNREQTVAAIGDDLYATAYDKPFRLPAASIFLLRAFSTLEALAKSLDDDFKFSEVARPYADEILQEKTGGINSPQQLFRSLVASLITGRQDSLSKELTKRVVGAGTDAVRAASRIEKIEKTLVQLERGDIKLRSRSTETEKLLRKQYSLTESSNYLLSTGTTALAATQLYAAGSLEPAVGMAIFSAVLGLTYLRKQAKLNRPDRF